VEKERNWYILQVKSGSEERVVSKLGRLLRVVDFTPFVPMFSYPYRRQGYLTEVPKLCFPGYVFIESRHDAARFKAETFRYFYALPDVLKLLHYGDAQDDIALRGEEQALLSRLLGADFRIGASSGVIGVNGRAHILSGPLVGLDDQITRVDRHRRLATVELRLLGATWDMCLMLELAAEYAAS
jgi:transcriptional antiterminator NusG